MNLELASLLQIFLFPMKIVNGIFDQFAEIEYRASESTSINQPYELHW